MFDEKWIREVIKRKIENGINKFVIFPFGNNGNIVKNCLLNYFDLKPELIIDNEYSKYNNKIQNIESLKQTYEKNLYVILTAEDRELNDKLQQELEDFIPVQNIINFLHIRDGYGREITNQFSLSSFLPNVPLQRKKKTKIW